MARRTSIGYFWMQTLPSKFTPKSSRQFTGFLPRLLLPSAVVVLAWPLLCWAQTPQANALPQGGVVGSGTASIHTSPSSLTVNQSSQKAIINWQSFNVGKDASVQFNQPNRDAITFNRVLDVNPSQILGQIKANGQVFLSNANGVVFGSSAMVDVGGLAVTVHDIRDKDMLEGRFLFDSGSKAAVINRGNLQSKLGGYIAMLAPEVRNEGVVFAKEGAVALASGREINLTLQGSQLVSINIAKPVMNALIENKHLIRADGGLVILSARSANAILESVITQSGEIKAPSIQNRNGRILLDAGERGSATINGRILANGTDKGSKGGRVVVTGEHVALTEQAKIFATGDAAGGEVLVGGSWQGQDSRIRQATTTTLAAGSQIDASAVQSGPGGTIAVWSNVKNPESKTTVAGHLKASGGQESGDGGRIETSGAHLEVNHAAIDASAPKGASGTWHIDPYNVTITNNNSNTNESPSGTWTARGNDSRILNTNIESALNQGTNVTISTTGAGTQFGDIYVTAPITSTTNNAQLNLIADRNIRVEQPITLSRNGSGSGSRVKLQAAGAAATGPAIQLSASVTADTLQLVASGGGAITQSAPIAVTNLGINAPTSAVTLTNADNDFGVLAATAASINAVTNTVLDLQHGQGGGLTISEATGITGITTTADINISTLQGHIYILKNVEAGTNLTLNAGSDRSPADFNLQNEKNIIVKGVGDVNCLALGCASPLPVVSAKTLGRLFTGSIEGSQNIAFIAGQGSGRFRYFGDETTQNWTRALAGTGLHVIYRERPVLRADAGANTIEYGAVPAFKARLSGFLNGDVEASSVTTSPTISIQATATSSSNFPVVGLHPTTVNVNSGVSDVGYAFSGVDGTARVTPKALLVTGFTGVPKEYDGTFAAQVSYPTPNAVVGTGLIPGDRIAANPSGTFASKNVGTGIAVLITHSFGGADASNYNITAQPTTTANITARDLTVRATAKNKVYSGNTLHNGYDLIPDAIPGDTVFAVATSASFESKNAGANLLQIGGITISGASAGNYRLMNTATTAAAEITPKQVKITGLRDLSKEYDGSKAISSYSGTPSIDKVSGDQVELSFGDSFSLEFTSPNVTASNPVRLIGANNGLDPVVLTGADSGNYSLQRPIDAQTQVALVDTTARINSKELTFESATRVDAQPYDGTKNVKNIMVDGILRGLVGTELVEVVATGTLDSGNAGTRGATLTYSLRDDNISGLASNYKLKDADSTQDIRNVEVRPLNISVSGIKAKSKDFDENTLAELDKSEMQIRVISDEVESGLIGNDTLTVSVTGTFEDANQGTGKNVLLSTALIDPSTNRAPVNYQLFRSEDLLSADIRRRPGLVAVAPGIYLDPTRRSPGSNAPFSLVYGTAPIDNYLIPAYVPVEAPATFANGAPQTKVAIGPPPSFRPPPLVVTPTDLSNPSPRRAESVVIRRPPLMGTAAAGRRPPAELEPAFTPDDSR